jgi:hypothetical protein
MYRREFEDLAHIGKTRFFSIVADPLTRKTLDYQCDDAGRGNVSRQAGLTFIRNLRKETTRPDERRISRLGLYATSAAPPRGRQCPSCRRRIASKATICRHCDAAVPPG